MIQGFGDVLALLKRSTGFIKMMGKDLCLPKAYPGPCFCGPISFLDSLPNHRLGLPCRFRQTPGAQQSQNELAGKLPSLGSRQRKGGHQAASTSEMDEGIMTGQQAN